MAKTIYCTSSDYITCTYNLTLTRSGSNVTLTASGTIYGNGSSEDSSSGVALYAHVCYGVSGQSDGTITSRGNHIPNTSGKSIISGPLTPSKIPSSGKSFTATWTWTNNSALSYSNCSLFISKSESSAGSSTGNDAYCFRGVVTGSPSASSNRPRYQVQSLSVDAGYTACGAPTTVSTNVSVQKPGGGVTISWSGATNGTNNKIKEYVIYYKIGGNPTTSSYTSYHVHDVTDGTTSGSWTYTFPESATRGNVYYFKVLARGVAGSSYYSGISSDNAFATVNKIPSAPSVTASDTKVPSGGGSITFKVTAGSTNISGQTAYLYYATSSTGTKTKFTSPLTKTISAKSTYYFYTYDGIEYSAATSKTISLNTKPATPSPTMTNIGIEYVKGGSTSYKAPVFKLQGKVTASAATRYAWQVRFKTSGGSWGDYSAVASTEDVASKSLVSSLGFGDSWQFRFRWGDAYEWSDWATSGLSGTNISAPTIGNVYNNAGNEKANISGSGGDGSSSSSRLHFYDRLKIYTSKDTGLKVNEITVGSFTPTIWWSDTSTKEVLKMSGLSSLAAGAYTLKVTFGHYASKGTITKTYYVQRSSTTAPLTAAQISVTNPIKPLSSNTFNVNFTTPTVDYKSGDNFTITGTNFTTQTKTLGSTTTNYNINTSNILNYSNNTTETRTLIFTFTDVFGQSFTVNKSITIDTKESFKTGTLNIRLNNNNNYISGTTKITQGDTIYYELTYQSYHSGTASVQCYIGRSKTDGGYTWSKIGNSVSKSFTNTSGILVVDIPINYTVTESNYLDFKIETNFNGSQTFPWSKSTGDTVYSQRWVEAKELKFQKLEFNEDDPNNTKLKWSHINYNSGGGIIIGNSSGEKNNYGGITSAKIKIQVQKDQVWKYLRTDGSLDVGNDYEILLTTSTTPNLVAAEESYSTVREPSFSSDNFGTNDRFLNVRLVFISIINNVEKITYGIVGQIFKLVPTVSYRENQIGINYKIIGNETDINTKAVFIGLSDSNRSLIVLDSVGTIRTIDIKTGAIDGFIIDGGSWS